MTPIPPLVVELRRSGRTVLVPPALTVLEALENEGIPIDSMCRAGICGTCETTALAATELLSPSAPCRATESRLADAPNPATAQGSPGASRRATESRSAGTLCPATEPGLPKPLLAAGSPIDHYPGTVRLCITAPGTLTHLVLDL
ncbi:2Fe-2S iron-sulfur cluster binding domain-containing protein [Nocardia sp. NPDC051756]|uniref:2Fe-2S iron-sulfur cluster-binding protein n=1 Tax=Nocardia sp. NPDC051756 TaxID=3154751 RepID=UPI0034493235